MPEAVAEQLKRRLGLNYVEGYGMTETMAATHINPPHAGQAAVPGHPDASTWTPAWSTR